MAVSCSADAWPPGLLNCDEALTAMQQVISFLCFIIVCLGEASSGSWMCLEYGSFAMVHGTGIVSNPARQLVIGNS